MPDTVAEVQPMVPVVVSVPADTANVELHDNVEQVTVGGYWVKIVDSVPVVQLIPAVGEQIPPLQAKVDEQVKLQ